MALKPTQRGERQTAYRLSEFSPANADLVASWVLDHQEALWLAPKTPPPITAEKIRRWNVTGHHPLQFQGMHESAPVAYGELNVLSGAAAHMWLGHLIVAPNRRGEGLGLALTLALLERAFSRHGARQVSLVVFPENTAAVASYRAAGMREVGLETHYLAPYERNADLLRFTVTHLL